MPGRPELDPPDSGGAGPGAGLGSIPIHALFRVKGGPGPDPAPRFSPAPGWGAHFLKVFGKPERLLTCECGRPGSTTLARAFQIGNGAAIRREQEGPGNHVGRCVAAGRDEHGIIEAIYLACLSRLPTPAGRPAALAYVAGEPDRRKAWGDVARAILNVTESRLSH